MSEEKNAVIASVNKAAEETVGKYKAENQSLKDVIEEQRGREKSLQVVSKDDITTLEEKVKELEKTKDNYKSSLDEVTR